jgi:hypothetical protein
VALSATTLTIKRPDETELLKRSHAVVETDLFRYSCANRCRDSAPPDVAQRVSIRMLRPGSRSLHSITSSAVANRAAGTVSPSVLAVLRLITS